MRSKRITLPGTAFYHCECGVRGQNMLLKDNEKRQLWELVRRVSEFSGVEVKTYCLMDNHIHLIIKIPKWREVGDDELVTRMRALYGELKTEERLAQWEASEAQDDAAQVEAEKNALKKRMYNLSDFFKTLKERFTKDFNRRAGCHGTLWSERFKSVLLAPESKLLTHVGKFADTNPVRSGVVAKAEDYKFSGFGAASRGDKSALDGIRELVDPNNKKHISVEKAFEEYKRLIDGMKRHAGGTSATPNAAKSTSSPSFPNFIAGVAIGSLKFIGELLLTFLEESDNIRRNYGMGPWKKPDDEYYRARRVNKHHSR